jgi:hypothetical protein
MCRRGFDLGFEPVDVRRLLRLEPIAVGLRRDAVAQRHIQRFGMGARMAFVDAGGAQAVDIR